MKNRIGMINGIIDGSISEAEASELMKGFPWLSDAVEHERARKSQSLPDKEIDYSPPSDIPDDGIDEEKDITEKPKRRGK